MQLVLFNEYRLGVIQNNRVVDAMAALEGLQFRRPQDLMESATGPHGGGYHPLGGAQAQD